MRYLKAALLVFLVSGLVASVGAFALHGDPTLASVRKHGDVRCGVGGDTPGFSLRDDRGRWSGLEVEFCRAVAAATLGDSNKVKFVTLSGREGFEALRAGTVDVLIANSATRLEPEVRRDVWDAAVIYFDGQLVAVGKNSGIDSARQLGGKPVCTLASTPDARNLGDWLGQKGLSFTPVTFRTRDEMYKAFYAGRCAAVSQNVTPLSVNIIVDGMGESYKVLRDDIIAMEPTAAYVRAGDEQWFDAVRWTFNALLIAEDRDLTQANVRQQRSSGSWEVRHMLGVPPSDGNALGLDAGWALNVIEQVGNYNEIFDRSLGRQTPFDFLRGINALSNRGGEMVPPPLDALTERQPQTAAASRVANTVSE